MWTVHLSRPWRAWPVLGDAWVADWPGSQSGQGGNKGEFSSSLLKSVAQGCGTLGRPPLAPGQMLSHPSGRGKQLCVTIRWWLRCREMDWQEAGFPVQQKDPQSLALPPALEAPNRVPWPSLHGLENRTHCSPGQPVLYPAKGTLPPAGALRVSKPRLRAQEGLA